MIRSNSTLMGTKIPVHETPQSSLNSDELIARAKAGDQGALSALFRRQLGPLRNWARGRLPRWARAVTDTADLVQEALLQTFRRLDRFDDRGRGALQAYLRRAIANRVVDEIRRVARRPIDFDDGEAGLEHPDEGPSPFDQVLDAEHEKLYKAALATLTEDERQLVVGRLELDYWYEQLALVSNRTTADAARIAVRRAVLKLVQRMSGV